MAHFATAPYSLKFFSTNSDNRAMRIQFGFRTSGYPTHPIPGQKPRDPLSYDSVKSILLSPKSNTNTHDRATARRALASYIEKNPAWAEQSPIKQTTEMTSIATSLIQTTDIWPPAANAKRHLGTAILDGILNHSWSSSVTNSAEEALKTSPSPNKTIQGNLMEHSPLYVTPLNLENWVPPIFERLNRLSSINGLFQTETMDIILHYTRLITQAAMPYAQVQIHDSERIASTLPAQLYLHSNNIETTETPGLAEGNTEVTAITRARLLLQWAKSRHTSALKNQCVATAKKLIGTAVLSIYQDTELYRQNISQRLTNNANHHILNIINNSMAILARQSKESGSEQLFPLSSTEHQSYLGIYALGSTLRITYYNLGQGCLQGNRNDTEKVPLLQIKLHPKDLEFSELKNRLMAIIVDADNGFEDLRTFFQTQLKESPEKCRLTAPIFNSQTSGNCVFKGLSAFLKMELGDDYPSFREYENTVFFNAIPPKYRQVFQNLKQEIKGGIVQSPSTPHHVPTITPVAMYG